MGDNNAEGEVVLPTEYPTLEFGYTKGTFEIDNDTLSQLIGQLIPALCNFSLEEEMFLYAYTHM